MPHTPPRRRFRFTKKDVAALVAEPTGYDARDEQQPGLIVRVNPPSSRNPDGLKTYYVVYRLRSGARNRTRLGRVEELSPDQAREFARQVLDDVRAGKNPRVVKLQAKAEAQREDRVRSLDRYLEHDYGPWYAQNRKTGFATVNRIRSVFPDLLDRKLPDLNPRLIEVWRTKRLKAGISPSTVNRDLAALKAALNRAVEWGFIDQHPIQAVKLSKTDRAAKVRYLDPDEEGRLRAALDGRDQRMKAKRTSANEWRRERDYDQLPELTGPFADHVTPMVMLSLHTGARRGEVFGLRWEDVDLDRRMMTIRGHTSKSATTRHVPLNDTAWSVLHRWKGMQVDVSGLVFPSQTGRTFNNTKRSWTNLLKDAGIESFRWHDMRHHFASKLVMAGVDLNTVRELLGHSDIKMTLRYAHLAPEHKARAVALLDGPGDRAP